MLSFDAVYTLSDLHLGAPRVYGADVALLAGTVRALAAHLPGERVALVLAGNLLDTLAAPEASGLRPDTAVERVGRILGDPAFSPVFDALGVFLAAPARTLFVGVGPHDLELALPDVQDALVERLTCSPGARASRVRFVPPGQGLRVSVGGVAVYVTHGDEVDPWNAVDAEALGRVVSAHVRGLPFDAAPWRMSAGSRLYLEAADVRDRFPFVALLGPPGAMLARVVLAVAPEALVHGPEVAVGGAPPSAEAVAAASPVVSGLLGGAPARVAGPNLLGSVVSGEVSRARTAARADPKSLLLEVEGARRSNRPLVEARPDGMLGACTPATGDALDAIRAALAEAANNVRSSERTWVDGATMALRARVGHDVRVVVAGHTCVPRVVRAAGGAAYLNVGTWMRVLRLDPADYSAAGWPGTWRALRTRTPAGLPRGLCEAHPRVGEVRETPSGAAAALRVPIAGTPAESWAADGPIHEVK